jgi:hypothetical protein
MQENDLKSKWLKIWTTPLANHWLVGTEILTIYTDTCFFSLKCILFGFNVKVEIIYGNHCILLFYHSWIFL